MYINAPLAPLRIYTESVLRARVEYAFHVFISLDYDISMYPWLSISADIIHMCQTNSVPDRQSQTLQMVRSMGSQLF